MIYPIPLLLCCLMFIQFNYGVDMDYFFDPALRSETNLKCKSTLKKINCQMLCGDKSGICIGKECYCIAVTKLKKDENKVYDLHRYKRPILVTISDLERTRRDDDGLPADINENREMTELEASRRNAEEAVDYLDESLLYGDKAILRHHIAHFCPNLDVARACIRTCMTEGKPAFCGKDHVCYCGHQYSNTDRDPPVNASNVYANFQDLYEKYFGPNYKPNISA